MDLKELETLTWYQWLYLSEEERRPYEHYFLNLMNEREYLDTARMEGKKEGLAIGKEEGIAIGRISDKEATARKMKEAGIDIVVISSITGLATERIADL